MRLRIVFALFVAACLVSQAQAAVSSWLSTVGTVGGGFSPGNPTLNLDLNSSATGSLYVWLRNDAVLQSVAYDLALATSGVAKITAVEVFQADILVGGTVDIGDRWNTPLANGTISVDQQSVTNFAAVNVNASGLAAATKTLDALFDAAANAALFARIDIMAMAAGSTAANLSEGSTLIVENSVQPPLVFGSATINVTGGGGGGDPPVVNPFNFTTTELGEIVSTTITALNDPTSWSGLTFVGFDPLLPGKIGSPVNDPSWDPATQAFSWDTSGSFRGKYTWTVTATNEFGTSVPGMIMVTVTVPEPATLSLFGLALVGIVGLTRRRS